MHYSRTVTNHGTAAFIILLATHAQKQVWNYRSYFSTIEKLLQCSLAGQANKNRLARKTNYNASCFNFVVENIDSQAASFELRSLRNLKSEVR